MYICNDNFELLEKIGNGNFGDIYRGKHRVSNQFVCIKIQPKNNEINTLKNEAIIYNFIQNTKGFPTLKYYSSDNNNTFLIINLLDKNLKQIKNTHNILSLKTIINIGIQMIHIIKTLHSFDLIHRDIKPENFMIGFNDKKETIHIIDFGFSKKYINNGKHIELRKNRDIVGTPNFISDNIKNGLEPSRRDDLISIIYILVYLYLNQEQWNETNISQNKFFTLQIFYEKMFIPYVFIKLLNYAYNLNFEEEPNYNYILNILKENDHTNQNFEWIIK